MKLDNNLYIILSEQDQLAILDCANRAYEINYPPLKYYNELLELADRIQIIRENKNNLLKEDIK